MQPVNRSATVSLLSSSFNDSCCVPSLPFLWAPVHTATYAVSPLPPPWLQCLPETSTEKSTEQGLTSKPLPQILKEEVTMGHCLPSM